MLEPGMIVESPTSSSSMPGGINSWDSKEDEGRGLVVGVLEALLEWERGWRKEKREVGHCRFWRRERWRKEKREVKALLEWAAHNTAH